MKEGFMEVDEMYSDEEELQDSAEEEVKGEQGKDIIQGEKLFQGYDNYVMKWDKNIEEKNVIWLIEDDRMKEENVELERKLRREYEAMMVNEIHSDEEDKYDKVDIKGHEYTKET